MLHGLTSKCINTYCEIIQKIFPKFYIRFIIRRLIKTENARKRFRCIPETKKKAAKVQKQKIFTNKNQEQEAYLTWKQVQYKHMSYTVDKLFKQNYGMRWDCANTWVGCCWRVSLTGLRWHIRSIHRRFNRVQISFFLELTDVLLVAYSLVAKPIRDLKNTWILYYKAVNKHLFSCRITPKANNRQLWFYPVCISLLAENCLMSKR